MFSSKLLTFLIFSVFSYYVYGVDSIHKICFATVGGTHLSVYLPVINEIISRGHNVTVFGPDGLIDDLPKFIGKPTDFLHYFFYKGALPEIPDSAMKMFWSNSRAGDAIIAVVNKYIIIGGFIRKFRDAITPELVQRLSSSCDLLMSDPFQWHIADLATKHNIPTIFCLNVAVYPPPFVLFPLNAPAPYSHPVQSTWYKQAVLDFVDMIFPFIDAISAHISGWIYYGYPRHLFATVFARPYFIASSAFTIMGAAIPRHVIPLGPFNPESAIISKKEKDRSKISSKDVIDLSEFVPTCRNNRPLVVAPKKLLFAAFGTNVRIPAESVEKLCSTFKIVLDSNQVDAVLFGHRLLGQIDEPNLTKNCLSPPQLVACNDSRIWSTSWVAQKEIFASGASGLFVSHGGFSSLLEVSSAQIPVVIFPIFGDQIDNADIIHHSEAGIQLMKRDEPNVIAKGMMKVLNNSQFYLDNMHELVRAGAIVSGFIKTTSESGSNTRKTSLHSIDHVQESLIGSAAIKAADLIELAVTGGSDNVLQKLVPYQWSVFASGKDPSFTSPAFIGAVLVLIVPVTFLILIGWLLNRFLTVIWNIFVLLFRNKSHKKPKKD